MLAKPKAVLSVNFHADNLIQPCIEAAVELSKPIILNILKNDNVTNDAFVMTAYIAKQYIDLVDVEIGLCASVKRFEDAVLATTTDCNFVCVPHMSELAEVLKLYHALHRDVWVRCESIEEVKQAKVLGADGTVVDASLVNKAGAIMPVITAVKEETIDSVRSIRAKGASTILLDGSLNTQATAYMRAQKEKNPYSIKVIEEYFRGYKECIKCYLKEVG